MFAQLLGFLDTLEPEICGTDQINRYFQNNYDLPADWSRVRRRYREMTRIHLDRFDNPELSMARAPGRVNLIWEHTDYNGLPCSPWP